ncbi:N-acetylglucosamine kinase [Paenibacillus wynnii]|uniref:ATPase n=1 Tax=Paenibacillus wynnii TaxID=268407 RepID=A0A098M8W1_9BACL|nr:BadF/BadG/BcrA/BcrD ATPase family protein [Paenibacillus wynnii]KGE18496.1 ATPase [Paenibacillus wynnii]
MKYYLGVDAGGSKTYALVTDQSGRALGVGIGGNGNYQTGYDIAKHNITTAVAEALVQAGLEPYEIEYAVFGLAGADRETDYNILRPLINELGVPRHEVVCDTMIALRAGTSRPHGVVLICGSGTNSAGKNPQGEFYQCGGFSYLFGDFGGGGSLAEEVFRSVIRAWDGREQPTLLTELLLSYLNYENVCAMFNDYLDHNKIPPIDTARLVFEAANLGDSVAREILRHQGQELAKSACAVINRLGMEKEVFDVVLAGSIVTRGQSDIIPSHIENAVQTIAPEARIVKLGIEPVIGAVWMAMEAAGGTLSQDAYKRLKIIKEFQTINLEKRG